MRVIRLHFVKVKSASCHGKNSALINSLGGNWRRLVPLIHTVMYSM